MTDQNDRVRICNADAAPDVAAAILPHHGLLLRGLGPEASAEILFTADEPPRRSRGFELRIRPGLRDSIISRMILLDEAGGPVSAGGGARVLPGANNRGAFTIATLNMIELCAIAGITTHRTVMIGPVIPMIGARMGMLPDKPARLAGRYAARLQDLRANFPSLDALHGQADAILQDGAKPQMVRRMIDLDSDVRPDLPRGPAERFLAMVLENGIALPETRAALLDQIHRRQERPLPYALLMMLNINWTGILDVQEPAARRMLNARARQYGITGFNPG